MSSSLTDDESAGAADLELLNVTNQLLSQIGLVDASSRTAKKVTSIDELQTVASSMFVAVYEARFHVRLDGIIRNPVDEADYGHNAQIVINALEDKIHIGLHHISGLSIAQGDRKAITNLVRILLHLVSTAGSTSMSIGSDEEEYADIDYAEWLGVRGAGQRAATGGVVAAASAGGGAPRGSKSAAGSRRKGKPSVGDAAGAAAKRAKTIPQPRRGAATGRGGARYGVTAARGHAATAHPTDGNTTNDLSTHSPSSVSSLDRDDLNTSGMAARAAQWMAVQQRANSQGRAKTRPISRGTGAVSLKRSSARSPVPAAWRVRSSGYGNNTGWRPSSRGTYRGLPVSAGQRRTMQHASANPTVLRRPQWVDVSHKDYAAKAMTGRPVAKVALPTALKSKSFSLDGIDTEPAWLKEVTGPLRHSISRELYTSYDELISISAHLHDACNKSAQNSAAQMEGLQKWTKKLEDARKRREELMRVSLTKSCEMNQRHDDMRNRIAERRWVDELARENLSFEQRVASQDYLLLKRAYKDLLKQLHDWKIDELREIRERVGSMKDNAKWHIKSLEQLFEDRLAMLKEQESNFVDSRNKLFAAGRNMENKLKCGSSADGGKTIQAKQSLLQQQRSSVILERREALSRLNDLNYMLLSNKIDMPQGQRDGRPSPTSTANSESRRSGQRSGVNIHHPSRYISTAAAPSAVGRKVKGRRNKGGAPVASTASAAASAVPAATATGESFGNMSTQRVTNPTADYYYNNIDHVTIPTSTTSTAADDDNDDINLEGENGDVSFGRGTDASTDLSEYKDYGAEDDDGVEDGAAGGDEDYGAEEGDTEYPSRSAAAGSSLKYFVSNTDEGSGGNEELDHSRSDYEYEDVEGGIDDEDEDDDAGAEGGDVGGGQEDEIEDNLMYNMINDAVRLQLQQEHHLHHQREWVRHHGAGADMEGENDGDSDGVGYVEGDDMLGEYDEEGELIYPSQSQQEPVQHPRQHIHYFGGGSSGHGNGEGGDGSQGDEPEPPSDHSTSSASTTDVGVTYNNADNYYG